eukprot:gene17799-20575_t
MSRLFNKLRGGEKEETTPADPDTPEISKEEEDALKEEARFTRVFELIRNDFIAERLNGSLEISYSFLLFGNTISCDVDGTNEETQPTTVDETNLGTLEKGILSSTKRGIRNLTNRAMAYKTKPYKEDMSLSCQVTVPVMGLASVSLSLSASIQSLLEAHDRRVALEAAEGKKK